jgi:hypothetical protein
MPDLELMNGLDDHAAKEVLRSLAVNDSEASHALLTARDHGDGYPLSSILGIAVTVRQHPRGGFVIHVTGEES